MLSVQGLSVEVGGRFTLADASFTLHAGDKVGLVGRNGAGKTSLLKVLGGEDEPAGGTIRHTGGLGYLPQDPRPQGVGRQATGFSHILSGRGLDKAAQRLDELRAALEHDKSDRALARFSDAEEGFFEAGGYAAEAQVRKLAAGLGLTVDRVDLAITALSGGERRRIELARILYGGSDVLMLDEPTNHLDTDAKAWLMGFLGTYRGALLVVSHDLHLLDKAITRILHLDEGRLIEYRGTYSEYRAARAADEERAAKTAGRQQAEIRRLSDQADSMRGQTAKRARVAKSIDRRVDKIRTSAVQGPVREKKYNVRLPDPPRSGRIVLEGEGLAKSYGATGPDGPGQATEAAAVFEGVDVTLERGRRLLVMGLNGAGKTSLLKVLAGTTEPTEGSVRLGMGVSVGYYAQEHEGIREGVSVLDHLRENGNAPDVELRALLGMFGLMGEIAFQDAGTLSGGEKTKLALAQLVAGRHNLLLLDEPTNNLDPPSRQAIGKALAGWSGTMVVVSHDTEFVNQLAADDALLLPEGTFQRWSDDLLDLVSLA
ncbi:MAG TPA: ABC-F family ATP-binding cassette domain-containing protein [Acidimicrobiales bacterium]|nr:ABC-F family ATP-binding cassette domain-containing protein [Acidimicrobiales bacterium]